MAYKLVECRHLIQHEETIKEHLAKLKNDILKNGYITPILVDKGSNVILDGHHRYNIMLSLGFDRIPAFCIDYFSDIVELMSWKKGLAITKEEVIQRGLKGRLFPAKTSKHMVTLSDKKILLSSIENI